MRSAWASSGTPPVPPRERRVGVEVVGVDVRRRAQAPREKEDVRVHAVDLHAVVGAACARAGTPRPGASRTGRSRSRGSARSTRASRAPPAWRRPRGARWRGGAASPPSPWRRAGRRRRRRRPARAGAGRRRRRATRVRSASHAANDEPLQVHPRGDRVKVVREALRLRDDARRARDGQRARGRARAAASRPSKTSASRTTAPDDGEDGLRRAPRVREDVGGRARPDEAIQRRDVDELDADEGDDVAVSREPGERAATRRARRRARTPASARRRGSGRLVVDARACSELREREERVRRLAEPGDDAERAGEPAQEPRLARSGLPRLARDGACATSCSATLGSRNQSKKLSRCARSQ